MFKLMGKKIFTILRLILCLSKPMEVERERERERKRPAIQHRSFGNMTPSWGSLKYDNELI